MERVWKDLPPNPGSYRVARDLYIGDMDKIRLERIAHEEALTAKEQARESKKAAILAQDEAYLSYAGNIAFSLASEEAGKPIATTFGSTAFSEQNAMVSFPGRVIQVVPANLANSAAA